MASNVFKLQICVDNAAFEESKTGEVARILEETANYVRGGGAFGRIKDVNGNRVGYWNFDVEGVE